MKLLGGSVVKRRKRGDNRDDFSPENWANLINTFKARQRTDLREIKRYERALKMAHRKYRRTIRDLTLARVRAALLRREG
jgi:hypothetical protein